MNEIIRYFTRNFDQLATVNIDLQIIHKIDRLNKIERSKLRNELFERAKFLEDSKDKSNVVNWLQNCFQLIDKYSYRFNKVYFSPGTEIKNSLAKILHDAHTSLDLCMFTITDNELARQIIACKKRKVIVRVITDDEKTEDKGSEIKKLVGNGVAVKIDHSKYHMHNKFGIIDGRIAITGSFNWTYTATKHNQENLLITSNFDIVSQYQEEFERLWKEMFEY